MEIEQIESFYNVFDIEYRINYGCKYNLMLYNRTIDKENYKITCIYDGKYGMPHLLDFRHYPDICEKCEYLYVKGLKPDIENYLQDLYKITPYVDELARQEVLYVEEHKEHSPNYYKVQEIFKS